ncbi:hypothetical protein AAFC00_005346 [Neodothiora populina]|uniref:RNA polymerase II subunit A C-terminal domain phosphatase n=1 Tax=Neodothiora populina TaxID=2781224 RepID=A0ABR3PKK1_9PEZI
MRLITPNSLHYPITVTKLLRSPRDHIERNAPLFSYLYKSTVIEGSEDNKEGSPVERTWPSTFESYVEGELGRWMIEEGKVITKAGTAIAEIEEPCKHEVQFGGMCAECGKDMTTVAYNTITRDTARATVNAVHGHTALLVSRAEASKEDEEAKRRLLSSRKLSLVVDLDQTIIHATVDPTVAEWQKDVNNPNHEAVKHVRAFQLVDDGPGARGCWYYIKLRPGLEQFLTTISKYFELHIYTMGTRAYAQNIAKIVDPDRKIFADRILSRDESGSMTAKSLKRLFPVDTKMVVIIDDRGDVWHWSQNLIKVTPYDFFVGIGDINSSFLPKRPELEAKPSKQPAVEATTEAVDHQPGALSLTENGHSGPTVDTPVQSPKVQTEPLIDPTLSAIDQLVSMGGGNDPDKLQEQTSKQDETIAAQLADRPLLRKQKILDAVESNTSVSAEAKSEGNEDEQQDDDTAESQQKYRHNLLRDDDTELHYLQESLETVHHAFFEEYDRNIAATHGGRVAELRPGSQKRSVDDLGQLPDVTTIMATMKQKVLRGCHLVFSGIMPLGVDVQSHDLAIWAKSFGATVSENIKRRTTHVIASPQRRTAKVRQAAKKPDRIAIVTQDWLFDSLSQWKRVGEEPYRIHSEVAENGEKPTEIGTTPFDEPDEHTALSSSDEEAALTEDELDTPNGTDVESNAREQAELAKYMPKLSHEDTSAHEETNEDWEDMNDELADFLGSDADDDSETDTESVRSLASTSSETAPSSAKKRKRELVDVASVSDDGDSDASQGESELQKRKRKALARTTSLTNVAAVSNVATPEPPRTKDVAADIPEDFEDSDADLEAQLEAEMLRQAQEDEESD